MRSYIFYYFFIILFCSLEIPTVGGTPLKHCKSVVNDDFIASIQSGNEQRCLGVILKKNMVLTTAMCVTDHAYRRFIGVVHIKQIECHCLDTLEVIYGMMKSNLIGLYCSHSIDVKKIYIHPKFNRTIYPFIEYDAAFLETDGNMKLESNFRPPSLPTKVDDPIMANVCERDGVVVGWWTDMKNKEPPADTICLTANIGVWSVCNKNKSPFRLSLMCTMDTSPGIRSFCKAHYGAPFFCTEIKSGKMRLRGLFSHRLGLEEDCKKDDPLFYTRVDNILDFITNVTGLSTFG